MPVLFFSLFFFFSSRRRHTRLVSDWSSDVCSSDLFEWRFGLAAVVATAHDVVATIAFISVMHLEVSLVVVGAVLTVRSEERRVGKECRSRRAPEHYKKKLHA